MFLIEDMGRRFGSELGWKFLDAIAEGFEIVQNSCSRPNAMMRYGLSGLRSLDAERERAKQKAIIRRLEHKGFIERQASDESRAYKITELGEGALLEHRKNEAPILEPDTFTIISFDIPEKYKASRQNLRRYLKALGFKRRHLSVWISDRDWSKIISKKMIMLDVKEWVVVIKGRITN